MTEQQPQPQPRPFSELSDSGLLWLVNRVALHPRGYALALHYDDDETVTGWSLLGDGTEPWSFEETIDNEKFLKVEELLGANRRL